MQVNVRLSPEIATLLEEVMTATGAYQAEVVESALLHAYGSPKG